jgi:hypothetical protein
MQTVQRNNRLIYLALLSLSLLIGCAAGESGGDRATVTIQSTPYPEIANMTSGISAYLDIAGNICQLNVDQDTTLSGQCPDIPLGAHPYTLEYRQSDTGAILATAEGAVTIEQGKNTEISFPPLIRYPFEPAAYYNTSAGPVDLAIGDLNNDDVIDVVTTNKDSDRLSVLSGSIDGSLSTAGVYLTGSDGTGRRYPGHVKLGDFNGDNNLDVAALNSGSENGYAGDLALFLGNGDGTLQGADLYANGDKPVSIAVDDLNGDGLHDIVVASSRTEDVRVLLGSRDGLLRSAGTYSTGVVNDITLGDMNGDGKLDMIVSIFYAQTIAVLIGNGDGTFQIGPSIAIGMLDSIVIGDVNGDTNLDMIVLIYDSPNASVFSGKGDGTFKAGTFYTAGNSPKSLALGDIDKDGYLDIVTGDSEANAIAVLSGNADGSFKPARFYEIGGSPVAVALEDLNGDGDLDICATIYESDLIAILLSR